MTEKKIDNQQEENILYEKHWYALHTNSRHEKQIHSKLLGIAIESFLPLRKLQRKWKDRKKIVEFPLFPGYLFVNIPLIEKSKVIQTKGVVKIVGNPTPIPEEQIKAVKTFLALDLNIDPFPEYIPGKEIEVKKGPLKGTRGFLVKKKKTYRLVVNLVLINQAISTEIDIDDVKLL